jgi:hypothetical protein
MIWLIISTLGYGSAWAFDSHLNELEEHQNITGDVNHAPEKDHLPCDHCCHAFVHLLGLWSSESGTTYLGAGTGYTPYRRILSIFSTAPPERPPQA